MTLLIVLVVLSALEIKLIRPEVIPISDSEVKITTKLRAAENMPKLSLSKLLERMIVKIKPQKADSKLPEKSMYVSFAVEEKARSLIFEIYLFTDILYINSFFITTILLTLVIIRVIINYGKIS